MELAVDITAITLTRETGQAILIGELVEVEVVRVSGGQVRIRVRAPRSVEVLRKELKEVAGD